MLWSSRSIAGCYGVGWSIAERCRVFSAYGFLELPSIACGSLELRSVAEFCGGVA